VVYENDWRYTDDELYHRTWTPTNSKYISQWYSPSGSFLYIPEVKEKVPCGEELELDVYYTAKDGNDYIFTSMVITFKAVCYYGATYDACMMVYCGIRRINVLICKVHQKFK